ncbi:MAG: DNA internalization-related competence protein ComEC/Rec2, partial [Lachnospiraceae bacterium]|nr:DNA internalization-related competence protein ComEC/Rec2 [Lachnospiraceae bacterium]
GLFRVLKKFGIPDGINTALCIIAMILYGIMIGMGTSVIRAILMFAMRLVAKLLKRTYDLLTASCVGVFFILFEQPLYIYHSGFLLSFLSVIALGAFRPLFPERICKVDFLNKQADSFFSTLTVWIVTLPVYGRFYYEVSMSGLILNVLILPFVSLVLVFAIGACVLGMVYLPFGVVAARICEAFLGAFETVFECCDMLCQRTLILGHMSLTQCFLYFLGLIILLFIKEKLKKRYLYSGLLILCAFLIVRFPKKLTITCLSVGQGDSAVIEYMDFVCVIDGGSSSEKEVAKYTILPFLKYRGIRKIDYLFLTHADSDHINGVEEILSQSQTGIQVERIVITDAALLEEYGAIWEMAVRYNIPIYEMKQGDGVTSGKLKLECMGPSEKILADVGESNNETSLLLLLQKDDFSMLFTADAEGKGEAAMLDRLRKLGVRYLTVLKVAHHGSKYSTSDEFLGWVLPQVSIISCGENNSYGHPHKETLERLEKAESKVFVTKDCGAVTIEMGKKIEVSGYFSRNDK